MTPAHDESGAAAHGAALVNSPVPPGKATILGILPRPEAEDFSRDLQSRCWFAVRRPGNPEASPRSHGVPRRGCASACLVIADERLTNEHANTPFGQRHGPAVP